MRDFISDYPAVFTAIVFIVLLVVVICGAMMFDRSICRSRAAALGLECTWGPLQDCIVIRQDGVRVPIDNYGRSDAQ